MKSNTNKPRLNAMLRGIQKSIDHFKSQGYDDVYFTAQFLRGGKKQNGIERGDVGKFMAQIRTYVHSEDADTVRLEFFDDSSGKAIYSKVLSDLRNPGPEQEKVNSNGNEGSNSSGLGGFNGLGEAEFNNLVDQRVEVRERQREFVRISKENEELRARNESLTSEKEELETTLKAKKDTEYYMGIIGTVFPGLASLFQGTRLANAASFLAGTSDLQGNALPATQESTDGETRSISAMVSEFCNTLSVEEARIIHMLFLAFEKDRRQMPRALQLLSQSPISESQNQ